jgi:hypothetical protein
MIRRPNMTRLALTDTQLFVCPLCPRKQTSREAFPKSALGQEQPTHCNKFGESWWEKI